MPGQQLSCRPCYRIRPGPQNNCYMYVNFLASSLILNFVVILYPLSQRTTFCLTFLLPNIFLVVGAGGITRVLLYMRQCSTTDLYLETPLTIVRLRCHKVPQTALGIFHTLTSDPQVAEVTACSSRLSFLPQFYWPSMLVSLDIKSVPTSLLLEPHLNLLTHYTFNTWKTKTGASGFNVSLSCRFWDRNWTTRTYL